MEERLRKQMEFLLEIDKVKSIFRQTLLIDGSRRENDAEHSWHLAMMAVILYEYAEPGVNLARVLEMTLAHDLTEIYAGDTFAYDAEGNKDKLQREEEAAKRLYALLPEDQGERLEALWREFDEGKTPDARFAAALDRIQPLIANYHTQGHTWKIGPVHSPQVYERNQPVREALPALWPYVEGIIKDSIQKGYLLE